MTPRKKILHLIKSFGRGGAETLLAEGLRHADRERFEYRYAYLMQGKDDLVQELQAQGADVVCFNARSSVGALFKVRHVAQLLSEWNADLLHCHLPISSVVGRLAGQRVGVPVVSTEHNLLERYHWATRRLTVRTWHLQRLVIPVSAEVDKSIVRNAGETVPRRMIRNGVSTEHFKPNPEQRSAVRHRLNIPEAAVVLGTVAVFRDQKRLDAWLRTARTLVDQHPHHTLRFIIVGDGPLREELHTLCGTLGLHDAVHFAGLQTDVRPFLGAMDIYLMSSQFEGLPVALLEAMAMALPIVATRVGGIGEVVRDDLEGHLVDAANVPGLADACGPLLSDPEARHRLGHAARERVATSFGLAAMVHELERTYDDILQGSL